MKVFKIVAFFFIIPLLTHSQDQEIRWHDPQSAPNAVIQGTAWPDALKGTYQRLRQDMKAKVRTPVWNLSHNTAGMYIEFTTNSPNIQVRYQITGSLNMPHMPTTGVSGLDLYQRGKEMKWVPGNYSFRDTIVYRFKAEDAMETTYRLYFPLYNGIKWFQIGTENGKTFSFVRVKDVQPIIIYGTSIAQGGCASRPGLAWTNILGRSLNTPIVNLAFSGNGRLEPELIQEIATVDARAYILDCMPNLSDSVLYPDEVLEKRITDAVSLLRFTKPNVPIVLTENSIGFSKDVVDAARIAQAQRSSRVIAKVYNNLKNSGVKKIYLLTNKALALEMDATVDGVHPNDIGMAQLATAYLKILQKISIH